MKVLIDISKRRVTFRNGFDWFLIKPSLATLLSIEDIDDAFRL